MPCSDNSIIGRGKNICWTCITPIDETEDIQILIFKRYGDRSICIDFDKSDCIFIKDNKELFTEEDIDDIKKFLVDDESREKNVAERKRVLSEIRSEKFQDLLVESMEIANEKGYAHHHKITFRH